MDECLNKRNHAMVDRCHEKVMKDNLGMDPVIALAWAVMVKNCYSSFWLVFVKQPTLPNLVTDKLPTLEGVTTSQSVAAHINTMYGPKGSSWRPSVTTGSGVPSGTR